MAARSSINEHEIALWEDACGLLGKRIRDVPELAAPRRKYIPRFRRLAEGNLALALLNALLWCWPSNPFATLAALGVLVNAGTMLHAELSAVALVRQLNRRAAEQLVRDLKGIRG